MIITEAIVFPSLPFWTSVRTIVHPLPRRVNSSHTVRQHQSAFVPLGPHAERDIPRRLIQLVRHLILSQVTSDHLQANEGVVFFDPFKEYVIVPEATRQK